MAENKNKKTSKKTTSSSSKPKKEVKVEKKVITPEVDDKNVEYDIVVEHLTKSFSRCRNDWERLKAIAFPKAKQARLKVLDDVSFKVKRGERVAFLGRNGSGKSTMLKILSKIIIPDAGTVDIRRRINILLEVSAGFNYEFTGRENIVIRGILLGLTKKQIKEVESKIIEFAELDEIFIDQQIKRYSSGMVAKLGVAINLFCNPEILIIDEALAVGDVAFQQKCADAVKQIWEERKCTLLFVSHSEVMVKGFCDRGIVIDKSKIVYDGPIEKAYEKYKTAIGNSMQS